MMNITVALRQLVASDRELKPLFTLLSERLEAQGATVILLPSEAGNGKLFKFWGVQVALALAQAGSFRTESANNPGIRFYYGSQRPEESLNLIAAIAWEVLRNKEVINYSLARRWEHWKRLCYYNFLRKVEVPSILIEFQHFEFKEDTILQLADCIVNGLAYCYGLSGKNWRDTGNESAKGLVHGYDQTFVDDKDVDDEEIKPPGFSREKQEDGGRIAASHGITLSPETGAEGGQTTSPTALILTLPETKAEGGDQTAAVTSEVSGEESRRQNDGGVEEQETVVKPVPEEPIARELPTSDNSKERSVAVGTGTIALKTRTRRYHWSGNPLAPPGEGPIYFFERRTGLLDASLPIERSWIPMPGSNVSIRSISVDHIGQMAWCNKGAEAYSEASNVLAQLKDLRNAVLLPEGTPSNYTVKKE
ncbi:MAG: hypothetical protein ACPLQP_06195 [Moorellaceae bacterium]